MAPLVLNILAGALVVLLVAFRRLFALPTDEIRAFGRQQRASVRMGFYAFAIAAIAFATIGLVLLATHGFVPVAILLAMLFTNLLRRIGRSRSDRTSNT